MNTQDELGGEAGENHVDFIRRAVQNIRSDYCVKLVYAGS